MIRQDAQRGSSMVEVLVAWVVLSIGLLGTGVATLRATQVTSGSYLRSQAVIAADSLADRIRANAPAAVRGDYLFDLGQDLPTSADSCTARDCDGRRLAEADLQQWYEQFQKVLPGLEVGIHCAAEPGCAAGSLQVITVVWEDSDPGSPADPGCAARAGPGRRCHQLQLVP